MESPQEVLYATTTSIALSQDVFKRTAGNGKKNVKGFVHITNPLNEKVTQTQM